MLKEIKEAIEKNPEIKKALQDCSDDFLLEHASLIYKALSDTEVFDGYKMRIWVEDNRLEWDYEPTKDSTKKEKQQREVAKRYTYELPAGQEKLYLIDLNQVTWTKDKIELAAACKNIISHYKSNNPIKGFWIFGNSNSGKTFASIALLNNLALEGATVAYANVGFLVSKVNETMSTWEESYSAIISALNKADVLVIDDFGVQKTTTWFNDNILTPILEYRSMSNKTTIFTSNNEIEELKNKMEFRVEFKKDDMETNEKLLSKVKQLIDKEIKIG